MNLMEFPFLAMILVNGCCSRRSAILESHVKGIVPVSFDISCPIVLDFVREFGSFQNHYGIVRLTLPPHGIYDSSEFRLISQRTSYLKV